MGGYKVEEFLFQNSLLKKKNHKTIAHFEENLSIGKIVEKYVSDAYKQYLEAYDNDCEKL